MRCTCVFFGELSVKVFGPFFKRFFPPYILDNSPLSGVFFLLTSSLAELKFLIKKKIQLISDIFHGSCLWCCIYKVIAIPKVIQVFFVLIYLFYLFLAVLGLRCCTWVFSSCGEWGLLFMQCTGIAVASLVAEHGALGMWASVVWPTGLVAPWHVGSSWTKARTCVPCIGRRILNHCTTREAPSHTVFILRYTQGVLQFCILHLGL